MAKGRTIDVHGGSWVIVAPPDFAPEVTNLVTLYDVMEEVALEDKSLVNPTTPPPRDPNTPDLENDIWPIAQRSAGYRWVSQVGLRGHGQGKPGDALNSKPETFDDFKTGLQSGGVALRNRFVDMVRPPVYESPAALRQGAGRRRCARKCGLHAAAGRRRRRLRDRSGPQLAHAHLRAVQAVDEVARLRRCAAGRHQTASGPIPGRRFGSSEHPDEIDPRTLRRRRLLSRHRSHRGHPRPEALRRGVSLQA
jgi:hypothetical protein